MMEGALDLARRGLAIFPLRPDNAPLVTNGVLDASRDLDVVRDWWVQWPEAGVGLAAGANGLVIIDLDRPKREGGPDGVLAFEALVAQHGAPPRTLTATTKSGGVHLFFADPGTGIRPSKSAVAPGIDVRAANSYVAIAPTPGYRFVDLTPPAPMPAWLAQAAFEATKTNVREVVPEAPPRELTAEERDGVAAYLEKTLAGIRSDLEEAKTWPVGYTDPRGRGWEKLCADKAFRLVQLAAAWWNDYSPQQARADFLAWAPRDASWSQRDVEHKFETQVAAVGRQGAAPLPADLGKSAGPSIFDMVKPEPGRDTPEAPQPQAAAAPDGPPPGTVDVTDHPAAFMWLRQVLGTGPLSGVFLRGTELVYAPCVGPDGFQPDEDRAIGALTPTALLARIQASYRTVARSPRGAWVSMLFPPAVANMACAATDLLPNVRPLNGVITAPVVRPDGTLLETPGYDPSTGLLLAPEGPQPAPVSEAPSPYELQQATELLRFMLQDFSFVHDSDRAAYLGLMLTPLLRLVTPAPWKLAIIEAHQPGSGKSFLGRALISLHGGAERAEMPSTDEEISKTVATILESTRGGAVMFDNVSGMVRSSTLAGLLTSERFVTRRLGTNQIIDLPNDRLWLITSNNATVGGDIARRALRVMIDPGVPDPERRSGFAITDFEGWVRQRRGDLLWALLTLIRGWFAAGAPLAFDGTGDSYARWRQVVGGILRWAGVPGGFDGRQEWSTVEDEEAAELGEFIATVRAEFGSRPWTTKDILAKVSPMEDTLPTHPIPINSLPTPVLKGFRGPVHLLGRALGRWVAYRKGRFVGTARIVDTGERYQRYVLWRIEDKLPL